MKWYSFHISVMFLTCGILRCFNLCLMDGLNSRPPQCESSQCTDKSVKPKTSNECEG